MLSSGTSGEPATDTPFPSYYGYALASLLTAPGAHLSALNSPSPTLTAFASRHGPSLSVMLINSDPAQAAPVSVRGMSGTLRTYTYSAASPQISQGATTGTAARAGIAVPPESIEVFQG